MKQTVGMTEAKSKLAELVGRTKYGNQVFILQRRGQPMAVLMSVDEYERLKSVATHQGKDASTSIPPNLLKRQRALVSRARHLRKRLGPPEKRLSELFSKLPPEDDNFWFELQEAI